MRRLTRRRPVPIVRWRGRHGGSPAPAGSGILLRKGGIRGPRRADHAHRKSGMAPARSDRRPGQLGTDPAPGRQPEPRVRPGRRHWQNSAGVPRSAPNRGYRAWGAPRRRGHGRRLGPPASHPQSLLRAGPGQLRADGRARVNPSTNFGGRLEGLTLVTRGPDGRLDRSGGALSRRPWSTAGAATAKLPDRAPVANVPPGPTSGATSPARPRPRAMTSNAMVLSAAAPHGGGGLRPLLARRTGTERAHRE